ncbi:MAG: hypothetical protein ACRDEB_02625 [Chitinophagaceae bacterium]
MIYATRELATQLTHIKEGDLLEQGLILKHKTGQWIIGRLPKDAITEKVSYDISRIDFKKKQYRTY